MSRSVGLVLSVMLLLTAVLAPAALAASKGMAASDKAKARWDSIPTVKRDAGLAKAESHKLFAKLTYNETTGSATGKFVQFQFQNTTGAVSDLTPIDGGVNYTFFRTIQPTPYAANRTPFVTGAVWRAPGENLTIQIHNNPTAVSSWRSDLNATTLVFTLADGVTSTGAGKQVRLNLGAVHGHLLTNGNASIEVGSTSLTVRLNASEKAMFRFHASAAAATANLHDANGAFVAGQLGSAGSVADGGQVAIDDVEDNDVETEITDIRSGRLAFTAAGDAQSPRVVMLTVDSDTFDATRLEAIIVKLNGQAVARVANASQAIAATTAAASLESVEGALVLVVTLPHMSTNLVTVEQSSATTSSSSTSGAASTTPKTTTPGFELVTVLLALAGLVVSWRRLR